MTIHDAADAHYFSRLLSLANLDIAAGITVPFLVSSCMAAIKYFNETNGHAGFCTGQPSCVLVLKEVLNLN